MINTIHDAVINDSIWDLLSKSTILTFAALFTTEFSLILMGIFGWTIFWGGIDAMVNCWCIILMFTKHSDLYKICSILKNVGMIYHVQNVPFIPLHHIHQIDHQQSVFVIINFQLY